MPRVPRGWYGVLASHELASGTIRSLHYFGRDLVAFRGDDGRATILDAFCPHYGAHLGIGGRIVDDRRYLAPIERRYTARTHVQEMRENVVDESHFHFIHGQASPSRIRFRADGPLAYCEARLEKRVFGVLVDNDFRAEMIGPGVMIVRTTGRHFEATAIAFTTPIDATRSELRMTYFLGRPSRLPFLAPLVPWVFARVSDPEVEAEVAIWDRKRYLTRPVLLPHETGIRELRRWYAQFYDVASLDSVPRAAE